MNHPLMQLFLRWLVLALGVALATRIIPGIHCDDAMTLLAVVVVLSFLNAILKPLLVIFTLPFILLSMGLGLIVINALLFMLVGRIVNGFHVAGFWSAIGAALVVGITNMVVSRLLKSKPRPPSPPSPPASRGDVIDI